ncbi:MAG TPA: hypothetical protein VK497_04850 [Candidatus Saccharimonadales bacterium]|nr:hypothetical protein [Candidatus Saccharimonadales bacterium]
MTQKKTNNEYTNNEQVIEEAPDQVGQDFKNAVLVVSMVANLAVATAWITLQIA